MKECIKEGWKVRELKRQINSSLFQRLALSTDKEGVDNQLFAARYQLYLPNRDELQAQLNLLLDNTKSK